MAPQSFGVSDTTEKADVIDKMFVSFLLKSGVSDSVRLHLFRETFTKKNTARNPYFRNKCMCGVRCLSSIGLKDHLHSPHVHFHNIGLWGSDIASKRGTSTWTLRTLSSIRTLLGHSEVTYRLQQQRQAYFFKVEEISGLVGPSWDGRWENKFLHTHEMKV